MDRGALQATVHEVSRVRHNLVAKTTNNMIIIVQLPSQAPQSFTISQSLLKFMSIELMMLPDHLILCHSLILMPSIFPNIRIFHKSQFGTSGGQNIGASASASVLPMNI